jgi:hypothetical protein
MFSKEKFSRKVWYAIETILETLLTILSKLERILMNQEDLDKRVKALADSQATVLQSVAAVDTLIKDFIANNTGAPLDFSGLDSALADQVKVNQAVTDLGNNFGVNTSPTNTAPETAPTDEAPAQHSVI